MDPTAESLPTKTSVAARPCSLDGKVLGLLDNSKQNAGRLLEIVADMLQDQFEIRAVEVCCQARRFQASAQGGHGQAGQRVRLRCCGGGGLRLLQSVQFARRNRAGEKGSAGSGNHNHRVHHTRQGYCSNTGCSRIPIRGSAPSHRKPHRRPP